VPDDDIRHAVEHAIGISNQDDGTRLFVGPGRDARLIEVVTAPRKRGTELVIHAMPLRRKYSWLLEGGR
jgi:hypothetical protein